MNFALAQNLHPDDMTVDRPLVWINIERSPFRPVVFWATDDYATKFLGENHHGDIAFEHKPTFS